jgi:hypothetical protein
MRREVQIPWQGKNLVVFGEILSLGGYRGIRKQSLVRPCEDAAVAMAMAGRFVHLRHSRATC